MIFYPFLGLEGVENDEQMGDPGLSSGLVHTLSRNSARLWLAMAGADSSLLAEFPRGLFSKEYFLTTRKKSTYSATEGSA